MKRLVSDTVYCRGIVGFQHRLYDSLNSNVSKMCIIIPDDKSRISFKNHCYREGWAFTDLDSVYDNWKKVNTSQDFCERMSGWSLFSSTSVSSSFVIIGSTIGYQSRYLLKYGWTIVLCTEQSESVSNLKVMDELNNVKVLYNLVIDNVESLKTFVYVKNSNSFGVRNAFLGAMTDIEEDNHVWSTIIHSIHHISKGLNLRPVFEDVGVNCLNDHSLLKLSEIGSNGRISNLISYNVMFSASDSPISKGGYNDESKQQLLISGLCLLNSSVKRVIFLGNKPVLNSDIVSLSEYTDGMSINEDFCFLIHRSISEYNLPHFNKDSLSYVKKVNEELLLCKKLKKSPFCKRIIYVMIVRPIYTTSIFVNNFFSVFHWPYDTLDTTRMILFYNQNFHPLDKTKVMIFGPPGSGKSTLIKELDDSYDAENGSNFIERRKNLFNNNSTFIGAADMPLYEYLRGEKIIKVLLLPPRDIYIKRFENRDKLNPEKKGQNALSVYDSMSKDRSFFDTVLDNVDINASLSFFRGLNLKSSNKLSITDLYFRSISYNYYIFNNCYESEQLHHRCMIGILNFVSSIKNDSGTISVYFGNKTSSKEYITISDDKNWTKKWNKGVSIFQLRDFIVMGISPVQNVYNSVTSCDGSNYIFNKYYVTTSLFSNSNINSFHFAQTQYMNLLPRILRMFFGFDALDVYKIRSFQAHFIHPDTDIMFNKKGNYIKDNEPVNISGHFINMVLASMIMPIDIPRWFRSIEGNAEMMIKNDKQIRKLIERTIEKGELVEEDGAYVLWHAPNDYVDCPAIIKEVASFLQLEAMDFKFINDWVSGFVDTYSKLFAPMVPRTMLIGSYAFHK